MKGIRIEGVDALLRKFSALESGGWLQNALRAAAIHVRGKVAEYPPVRHGTNPLLRTNAKMRRGFFYHLRRGDIEVPYRRGQSKGSETLGRRWTARMVGKNTAVIGNNASYAKLVQGRRSQTMYHNITGWKTAETVAEEEAYMVRTILGNYLQKEIQK